MDYRNWCPVCVKSRGKALSHRRDGGYDRCVPEYSFDYCFPGDELGFKWTVLVGRERLSKSWGCWAIPMKGYTEGRYAMQKVLEFIHENGDTDNRIIIKSDGEASIQFLVKEVVEARQQGCKEVKPRILVEQSPEGCSASDGVVEAAVQEMDGIIRALLIAVEEYLGVEVDARERLIAFIPEYAAYLINRLRKGEDLSLIHI